MLAGVRGILFLGFGRLVVGIPNSLAKSCPSPEWSNGDGKRARHFDIGFGLILVGLAKALANTCTVRLCPGISILGCSLGALRNVLQTLVSVRGALILGFSLALWWRHPVPKTSREGCQIAWRLPLWFPVCCFSAVRCRRSSLSSGICPLAGRTRPQEGKIRCSGRTSRAPTAGCG